MSHLNLQVNILLSEKFQCRPSNRDKILKIFAFFQLDFDSYFTAAQNSDV